MTDDGLRRVVEQCWAALEAEQTNSDRGIRVSPLPVGTTGGPVAVGVDHEGRRHLLVPIHAHQKVRTGLDGPVLQLRKRPLEDREMYQTYADLGCLRSDFDDLFTTLCVDVLVAADANPQPPVKALYRVIDRWRALFRTESKPLGPELVAGLFGELIVLNRLLERDANAHRLWHGPNGFRHDFASMSVALEVKSATTGFGRRPRIHGADQLEAPETGVLYLVWIRLQRAAPDGPGIGLIESIELALGLCDDESTLLALLAGAGFHLADIDHYRDVRFTIGEEAWYLVDAEFPALTSRTLAAAGVPSTVLEIDYTVDLSGDHPIPVACDAVPEILDTLIQESA